MATLSIRGVRKSFGALEVLSNIDLELEDGGFLVLLGPSGCGKSTLLSIIAGLEPSSGGDVFIGERKVNDVHPKDRNIAMVFQSYALYPTMSVGRNIGFGLEMRKVDKAGREAAVRRAAELLQIEHLLERKPGQLSGGQRQRVAMGRALARDPRLFLFDEPLSNLDAKLRVEMRAEIKRLHLLSGITTVYVTHDQIEAMTLGSRIAVMKGGVLQQIGSPDEIYRNPVNTYVAGFIGSPTMNFIDGRVERQGDQSRFVFPGGALALPCPDTIEATLGQRPEHVHLSDDAPWRGEVVLIEPTGADTYVVLKTGAGLITLRAPANTRVALGETVGLTVSERHSNWFDKASGQRLR